MKKIIVRRKAIHPPELSEFPPLLQRIYHARGIQNRQELSRDLSHLLSYESLSNISEAVAIIEASMRAGEHIMIIGDFDADGATSTALVVSCLKKMGATRVSYLVPNRFAYGYGLTPEIVDVAKNESPDLLITVDNGIASHEGVIRAHELGIRVIITDHHLPAKTLPEADAIVNPNLPGDLFQSKNLAGVGVAFYVMLALRAKLRESQWFTENGINPPNMASFLDLVALGTVADVVPLDANNRILVHNGLRRIRAGELRTGIRALIEVAGRDLERLSASDLGFSIAPRLNAAGRLVDMAVGIECLLTEDPAQASENASKLDALNKERQQLEEGMREQAMETVAGLQLEQQTPWGLCLYDESWHQGIIGILAARVKEKLNRPVFAFAIHKEDELKGSGRSIAGLHLKDVLEEIATNNPGLIAKFGGHAMAAGMSISLENLPRFKALFEQTVGETLPPEHFQGVIHTDGELPRVAMTLDVAALLREAGPWGQGFPEPLFDGRFQVVSHRVLKDRHVKFTLSTMDQSFKVPAIAFNLEPDRLSFRGNETLHVVYRLDINAYRGDRQIQLLIEYFDILSS